LIGLGLSLTRSNSSQGLQGSRHAELNQAHN